MISDPLGRYLFSRVPLLFLCSGAACLCSAAPLVASDEPRQVDFNRDVLPIFKKKCFACHSETQPKGGLDMTSRAAMLKGGHSGAALLPGKPDESLMIELIEFNEMPPRKDQDRRVSGAELHTLRAWIAAGAGAP